MKTPEVMAGVVAIGIIGLVTDQLLRQRLRQAARQCMELYYDWNVPLGQLEQLLVASLRPGLSLGTVPPCAKNVTSPRQGSVNHAG